MSRAAMAHSGGDVEPERLHARVRPLGMGLARALKEVLRAIPGAPHRPTPLARTLGLSRVTIGRILNAVDRPSPYETLEQLPGPDSLRAMTRAAAELGVDQVLIEQANATIDTFADLIRKDFGTRDALNAAITEKRPELKKRFARSSRYQVYMGMRQILGIEADTWLTSMLFVPAPDDDDRLIVTAIHGALAMRRLRPEVGVHFIFGPPPQISSQPADIMRSPIDLQEFYTHAPAPLETHEAGGQLVHRLAHDRLGRRATVDMLAVCQDAQGSRRYATPQRPHGGVVVFPDIPVKTLICDAVLHDDVFPGSEPELIVYNPGSRGPANPCNPHRDIDRIDVPERIVSLGKADDRFEVPEVPRYPEMIGRVCEMIGHSPEGFRVHRLRMTYPVHGFQIVMAFDAPTRPE